MSGRQEAIKLVAERDALEQEIETTRQKLAESGAGVNEPLVTSDGFPRQDIDVATVRELRVQLIRQQNDMKALLDKIRVALASAFPPKQTSTSPPAVNAAAHKPFCLVKAVVSGSLGDEAGLVADDEIVRFGNVSKLADLSTEFKTHEGKQLSIEIVRRGSPITLHIQVIPGRSLGCHIVPK